MYKQAITFLLLASSLFSISQLQTKKYIRSVTNNSENEIAPFLSLDGSTLIYTRKRDMEEHWKTQISVFQGGKWQRPQSFDVLNQSLPQRLLGSYALNTDGSKVLFVSKKYGGIGTYDIWITKKSSGENWSTAENLAKPINTADEEINPIFSQDEKSIYFVRRSPGTENGVVYQSKMRTDVLWKTPVSLGFTGTFFAIRIAADNKTMYLSKKIGVETKIFVSRLEDRKWSEPIEITGFPKSTNSYFTSNITSTNLTISAKMDLTYDLYEVKIPEEHESTAITNLSIDIEAPHKVRIIKNNDSKFNVMSMDVKNLYLLNDDTYTISILFKDYFPIVNEVNLDKKGYSEQHLAPRPIRLESGAISVLDFYEADGSTIHESLFSNEINAIKNTAYSNPTKNFEITHFQNITINEAKSATHFTEVIDTLVSTDTLVATDGTIQLDNIETVKTRYSNDNTEATLKEIEKLCGILPNNVSLVIKKEELNNFPKPSGVYVTLN